MALEQRANGIADVQSMEGHTLQARQRRLEALESTIKDKLENVDPRVEVLEGLVRDLPGKLQTQEAVIGQFSTVDVRPRETDDGNNDVARASQDFASGCGGSFSRSGGLVGGGCLPAECPMKNDDRRWRSALQRVEALETESTKLHQRCDETEMAMSERTRLLSQGDVSSGAVPQQEGGRGAPSQHKKIEPLDLDPKGTEWHQMSPEVGEKQECVEVGGYGEDWPEPTRWPDPGWGPASTSAILQRIIRTSTLGAAERLSGPQANPRRTLGVGVSASTVGNRNELQIFSRCRVLWTVFSIENAASPCALPYQKASYIGRVRNEAGNHVD